MRGQLSTRDDPKRADYLLYFKPGIPLAVLEAKDNNHSVGAGVQQALDYVDTLDMPFVFSSNGDTFVFHDRTGHSSANAFTLASYLIRVSLDASVALPEYFNHVINSSYYRTTQIEPELTQQCGQADFSGSKLASSVVPLPPLAEQKRIVAKVEELMGWCDRLETHLATARTAGAHLLDATLSQLLNGAGNPETMRIER